MLFQSLLVGGFLHGAVLALAALGFAIIFATANELHFAYGNTVVVAGYLLYTLTTDTALPLAAAVVVVIFACGLLGAAIRLLLYRYAGGHQAVLLVSFGLAIIMENAVQAIYGAYDKTVSPGGLGDNVRIIGTQVTERWIDLLGLAVLLVVWPLTVLALRRTHMGLGLTATMRDPEMAALSGVRPERMKVVAYVAGSMLAAVVGMLNTLGSGINPGSGLEYLLLAFIAALLAREKIGQIPVWGLLIGIGLSLSAWKLPSQYQTLTTYGVVLVLLVIRMRRQPRVALA